MSNLDWIILLTTLAFIVIYGSWVTRGRQDMDDFLKAGNEAKWWTVGISVMATQASAITFMSTPGQAYEDGMGFVQVYFGLPLAMIVIAITFVPIYHRLKVYTAYEYLEQRFDLKTRTLTALLFLIQRGLGTGLTIFAPSIILSTILGWNLNLLNVIIGGLVIFYTMSGGSRAVNVTQKQQFFIIFAGMISAFVVIINSLPPDVTFSKAMTLAGASEKLNIVNFDLDLNSRYTFWSGITGGFFLALSYFGTDQSQVGRYLSGESIRESQLGLIMNGLLKVPMQFFILMVGVMVFIFYQYNPSPVFFNKATLAKLENTEGKNELMSLQSSHDSIINEKKTILESWKTEKPSTEWANVLKAEKTNRDKVKALITEHLPDEEKNDKDYVFISFILTYLPRGLIGLLLAVIFAAAMSSTASALNALASTTTIDIYKRSYKQHESDDHYVSVSKVFTIVWGLIAIGFACIGSLFENLIQFVNIVGSIFYGTILGVFVVGFYIKKIKGNQVFIAACLSQIIVLWIYFGIEISYLWLNVIGCFNVIILGSILQSISPRDSSPQLNN
jgi:solute:Na+ symporter, SSS family